MTKNSWTVTRFLSNAGESILAYRPRISDRLFCEAGILKDCHAMFCQSSAAAFLCVLQNVWQTFLWNRRFHGLTCLILAKLQSFFPLYTDFTVWTAYGQQLGQVQFLAQMASLATLKANSMWSFFDAYHLLWSKSVLPWADLSHCHKKPYFNQTF